MKKLLIFFGIFISLFLVFKYDVKADEEASQCSSDSTKKAIKSPFDENKELCYSENEGVYCSKKTDSLKDCFIIDRSSKTENSNTGTVTYATTWNGNSVNLTEKDIKFMTTTDDPLVSDTDMWWDSVYACKAEEDYISKIMAGNSISNVVVIFDMLFGDGGTYGIYTDSLATVMKDINKNDLVKFNACSTFTIRNVPKSKRKASCSKINTRTGQISTFLNQYTDESNKTTYHNKKLVNSYKKTVNEITSLCRQVLEYENFDEPCLSACLDINDVIANWNESFGVESSKNNCGFSQKLVAWILNILKWIKYIIPVAVIVLGILDFIKATASDKDDDMKKAQGRFVKRLIAAALIFLVPLLIEFVLPKLGFDYNSCGLF